MVYFPLFNKDSLDRFSNQINQFKDLGLSALKNSKHLLKYRTFLLACMALLFESFARSVDAIRNIINDFDFSAVTTDGIDFATFTTYGYYLEVFNYVFPVEEVVIYTVFLLNLFITMSILKLARSIRPSNYI